MSVTAETLAINKKKQKKVKKSIDNVKKLLETGDLTVEENVKPKTKKLGIKKRGVVYLSNIPHGFYEEEMQEYFKQFGHVTNLRLARSKKTGNSKGFAFIEFKIPEVAKIVAETMNNYLMYKRLLKASYIPPEKQMNYFTGNNWTQDNYPRLRNRKKHLRNNHSMKSEQFVKTATKRYLNKIEKIKKTLQDVGIDFDFKPLDAPSEEKLNKKSQKSGKKTVKAPTESVVSSAEPITAPIKSAARRTKSVAPPTKLVAASSKSLASTKSVASPRKPLAPPIENESDSDVIFQPSSVIKKVLKKKSKTLEKETKKETKKLSGVTKKSKIAKLPLEKESKKMKLIKANLLQSDQVEIKSMKDIKKKKNKVTLSKKSPKVKKSK